MLSKESKCPLQDYAHLHSLIHNLHEEEVEAPPAPHLLDPYRARLPALNVVEDHAPAASPAENFLNAYHDFQVPCSM